MNEKKDGIDVLEEGRRAIEVEIEGLRRVRERLDGQFEEAARLILSSKGRVVITGIGKSGLVGRKIAATLASTGTPSIFLHPAEALHGDLGVVMPGDVVIAISNSGETQEVNALLPAFRDRRVPVIAFTGCPDSTLAKYANCTVDTGVEREACALGLAPTASTTACLAVGDALAVVLLKLRRFSEKDFRRNHPSGTLGERLKVSVGQVMLTGELIPRVKTGLLMEEVVRVIDEKRLGAAVVIDQKDFLIGIVTDGDLRRAMVRLGQDFTRMKVDEIMTQNPKTVMPDALAADALALMETHLITVLPVVGQDGRLQGIVHLHDLLGKGQFKFIV